ncbi:MAG: hypothetical protein ACRD0Z_07845 [Acidimicrobiales bacterium]
MSQPPQAETWAALQASVSQLRLAPEHVEASVHHLSVVDKARFADLFGVIENDRLVLRAVFALERDGRYAVVEWPVEGENYPQLSDIAPAAFVEECEIYERFGARPFGDKPLNRVLMAPHAEDSFQRLGFELPADRRDALAPHFVAGEAFEFPVGPVRGVAQESLYLGLVTSGEEVIDVYLHQWHKHRGIDQRLQGLPLRGALFFAERLEGLSAVGNAWAFCRAAETITGLVPSDGTELARGVALELERLYNHAAAVAALCQSTGLSVGQAQSELALEQFLRLNAACGGHRYLFGVLAVGGLNRAIEPEPVGALLRPAVDELRRVISALLVSNSFLDRLEACGIVTPEEAGRLGLVGPVARGSGQEVDCRRHRSDGPYAGRGLSVPVRQAGDVLSRFEVMIAEIDESTRLIGEMIAAGLDGSLMEPSADAGGTAQAAESGVAGGSGEGVGPTGQALGWCESSRGESLAWLSVEDGLIRSARLRPASVRNWRAFDDACRSRNVFTDVAIIEASFWLTVAGFAR